MGTNYYAKKRKPRIIFKRVYDEIHLGKSSAGWKFCFQETDEIKSYEDFLKWLDKNEKDYKIINEYGREVKKEDLIELINSLQKNENEDNFEYQKNINGYRFYKNDFS